MYRRLFLILVLALVGGTAWAADDHHATNKSLVTINGEPVGLVDGNVATSDAPSTYTAGRKITFAARTDHFSKGTEYKWVWGDNTADSEGQTAQHTFKDAGTYDVGLFYRTSGGAWIQATTISVPAAARVVDMSKMLVIIMLGVCVLVVVIIGIYFKKQRDDAQ